MKKTILRNFYQLQILEDGSSLYSWVHPFNTRLLLRSNDITVNSFWNDPKFDSSQKIEPIVESGSESD
jgi:hypothetical protein